MPTADILHRLSSSCSPEVTEANVDTAGEPSLVHYCWHGAYQGLSVYCILDECEDLCLQGLGCHLHNVLCLGGVQMGGGSSPEHSGRYKS